MSYEKVTKFKSRLIIGRKQTLKAMKHGQISEVVIADDADQSVTGEIEELAEVLGVTCSKVNSKKKLGAACGIEVPASAVAIKKTLP